MGELGKAGRSRNTYRVEVWNGIMEENKTETQLCRFEKKWDQPPPLALMSEGDRRIVRETLRGKRSAMNKRKRKRKQTQTK